MMLRLSSLTVLMASTFAFLSGCSGADYEEDDVAQQQAELVGDAVRPISRKDCERAGGSIAQSPLDVSRICKRSGFSGDVCTIEPDRRSCPATLDAVSVVCPDITRCIK